jgi:hypothetical protein
VAGIDGFIELRAGGLSSKYYIAFGLYYVRLYLGRSASGEMRGEGSRGIKYGVLGLDLDELGDRTVKAVFTYPLDWRRYVPTDRVWNKQWSEFLGKWKQRWGSPVGYWGKEFQPRVDQAAQYQQAPHMNWVCRWPESAGGYAGVLARTKRVRSAEGRRDFYGARSAFQEIVSGLDRWMHKAWSEVVTGNDGSEEAKKHYGRGTQVRVNYFSESWAEKADRADVAWYIARDVGKSAQKRVPAGFGRVRPWWGCVNMRRQEPVIEELSYLAFVRMHERLRRWCDKRWPGLVTGLGPGFGGIMAPGMRGEEGLAVLLEIEETIRQEESVGF